MAKIPITAHIVAKSSSGPKRPVSVTLEQIIDATEADLRSLRAWAAVDPKTPMMVEIGRRLIDVGSLLVQKGDRQ
jgi:hypothetical protein